MQIKLSIRCSKVAGILARAIVALRRAKFKVVSQHTEERNDGTFIELIVEGTASDTDRLTQVVSSLDGVLSVEAHSEASDEQPSFGATSELKLESLSDSANRIAKEFPDIEVLVDHQRTQYEKDEAAQQMRSLGISVATLREQHFAGIRPGDSIEQIIRSHLIADIAPFADAQYDDDGLKIMSSIFTKPKKTAKPEKKRGFGFSLGSIDTNIEKCDFLCGYVQGIVDHANWLNRMQVTETYCRREGQPFCLFEFTND